MRNMRFQQDTELAYFPITLENAKNQQSRYFYVSDIQFALPSACRFCLTHGLSRSYCKMFVDHANTQLQQYFGDQYGGQLWCLQYVLNALETIAASAAHFHHSAASLSSGLISAAFVEIGTSNFDTVTQLVDPREGLVGFAVEPSAHYLRSLPDRPNVTKVNCAIVTANSLPGGGAQAQDQTVDLYHVPEAVIDRLGLYYYLKGCNSIGAYHPEHISQGVQKHVVVDKVPAFTITQFLNKHRIQRIQLLKIDAEGYDLTIMEELYQHIVHKYSPIVHVDRIFFESNDPEQQSTIDDLVRKYNKLGYRLIMTGENTILEKIKV